MTTTDYGIAPPRAEELRRDVSFASGLNLLAGVWLLASPLVFDYSDGARWNALAAGAVVTLLAAMRTAFAFRVAAFSWINMLVGIWLFASPWVLETSAAVTWNNVVVGFSISLWGFLSALSTPGRGSGMPTDDELPRPPARQ